MKEFMGGFLCLIEAWTVDGSPVVGAGVRNEAPNAAVGAGMRAKQAFRAEKHHHVWRGLPNMVGYCIIINTTALDHALHDLRHL